MAKKDALRGLTADLAATKADVVGACKRVTPALNGGRLTAEVQELSGGARVSMLVQPPFKPNAAKNVSWQAVVRVRDAGEGRARVDIGLENYKLYAPKTLGIIPVGPAQLLCKKQYFLLLDGLQRELLALDRSASVEIQ